MGSGETRMKFNKWSMKRIKEGTKTLTSRKNRIYGDPHVAGIVGPLPWWFIRQFLYRDEGAESPEELQRVINQIFRRDVGELEEFFVHVIDRGQVIKE